MSTETTTQHNSEKDNFDYQLLARLKTDCEYYLNTRENKLWAGSPEEQIAKMREIYSALEQKPEWISPEDIDEYERRFIELNKSISENATEVDFKGNIKMEENMEDLNKAFIQQLKKARIQKGISVIELCKRTGWPRSVVYRLETGELSPKASTIIEYLSAIDCQLAISDEKPLEQTVDTKAQAIINKLSALQNTLAKLTAEANAIAAEINEIISHTSAPERFPEEEQIVGGDFNADNDIDI